MPDPLAGRQCLGGAHDAFCVDAIVAVKVGDAAGLAEMLNAK